MKNLVSLIIVMFVVLANTKASNYELSKNGEPQFALKIKNWVGTHINYPQKAIELKTEGIVYVGFVVNVDGQIENVEILEGVSEELDAAALMTFAEMPIEELVLSAPYESTNYILPIKFVIK